jgi:hypothetical protein
MRHPLTTERRTSGYWLAALGAAGLIFSLWQSWYSFRVPGSLVEQAKQLAPQFGPMGALIAQGAQFAQQLGTLHATAWQVYHVTPAILLLLGAVIGGLSLLAITERADAVGQIIAGAAMIAAAVVVYRLISPAGSDGLLHPAWGIELALGSAALALVGGLLSAAGEQTHAATTTTWTPPQSRWGQPAAWNPYETPSQSDPDAPDAHYLS